MANQFTDPYFSEHTGPTIDDAVNKAKGVQAAIQAAIAPLATKAELTQTNTNVQNLGTQKANKTELEAEKARAEAAEATKADKTKLTAEEVRAKAAEQANADVIATLGQKQTQISLSVFGVKGLKMDLTSKIVDGTINGSGVWVLSASKSLLISVEGKHLVSIERGETTMQYSFFINDTLSANVAPNYATGYSGRKTSSVDVFDLSVPKDAKWLWILIDYNGDKRYTPKDIFLDGISVCLANQLNELLEKEKSTRTLLDNTRSELSYSASNAYFDSPQKAINTQDQFALSLIKGITKNSRNLFVGYFTPYTSVNSNNGLYFFSLENIHSATSTPIEVDTVSSISQYTLSCESDISSLTNIRAFYYKSDGEYISVQTISTSNNVCNVPANTKYIRFSLRKENDAIGAAQLGRWQLEKGSVKTPYTDPLQPKVQGGGEKDFSAMNFLILGDSISYVEERWVAPFMEIIKPMSYTNVAVSGAHWMDYTTTTRPYNGTPELGTSDQVNNVICNQVQKVLNNNYAADVIIIFAGTNDYLATTYEADVESQYTQGGTSYISIDNTDNKTFEGATRWAITKLKEKYPNAYIFIVTPIQCAVDINKRVYAEQAKKVEVIKQCANRLSIPIIDAFTESTITSDREHNGVEGVYTVDGLHPNTHGGEILGRYIASQIAGHVASV